MREPACYECGGTPETCQCEEFVECTCVRVDVDLEDARNCMAHGPRSKSAKAARQQEADDNFAFYSGGGEW